MRGGGLLLVLIVGLTLFDLGRFFLPAEEGPVFFMAASRAVWVQIEGLGGDRDGIHQINDARKLISVIYLAIQDIPPSLRRELAESFPLDSGRMYKFQVVSGEVRSVEIDWMTAAARIALGIPLRVERMSQQDWQDLPGAGPVLAARIERYRQKNGDLDSFSRLILVPGIGKKLLKRWAPFFYQG